ncbi:hypothetical protein V8C86DRAFT_2445509 [Haematococcus lacustris]
MSMPDDLAADMHEMSECLACDLPLDMHDAKGACLINPGFQQAWTRDGSKPAPHKQGLGPGTPSCQKHITKFIKNLPRHIALKGLLDPRRELLTLMLLAYHQVKQNFKLSQVRAQVTYSIAATNVGLLLRWLPCYQYQVMLLQALRVAHITQLRLPPPPPSPPSPLPSPAILS